jgi:hypothetical protein
MDIQQSKGTVKLSLAQKKEMTVCDFSICRYNIDDLERPFFGIVRDCELFLGGVGNQEVSGCRSELPQTGSKYG